MYSSIISVDPKTYRMNLFMDNDWKIRRTAVSYGHDIEASWLLPEAANVLAERNSTDKALQKTIRTLAYKYGSCCRNRL